MPKEIEAWLLTYESKIETYRSKIYLSCEYTSEPVKLADIQIDHRIPISRGGSFGVENLAITSGKSNQHKSELTGAEFLQLLLLLDTFDSAAKTNVLSRLRSGGGNRFRR